MIDFDFIELTSAEGNYMPTGTKIQVRAGEVALCYADKGGTFVRLSDTSAGYYVQEDVTEVLNRVRKAF